MDMRNNIFQGLFFSGRYNMDASAKIPACHNNQNSTLKGQPIPIRALLRSQWSKETLFLLKHG